MTSIPIRIYSNPDKKFKWESSNPLLPSSSDRFCITGPPGCGKRVALLNILTHLDSWPDKIAVLHLDTRSSEYKKLKPEIFTLDELPSIEDFDNRSNNVLIIDEVDLSVLKKVERSQIERIFSYSATHSNLMIFLVFQQFTTIPVAIRRACNQYIIFKGFDRNQIGLLATRVNCNVPDFVALMGLCRAPTDSIWVDMSKPIEKEGHFRLNLWEPVRFLTGTPLSKKDDPIRENPPSLRSSAVDDKDMEPSLSSVVSEEDVPTHKPRKRSTKSKVRDR